MSRLADQHPELHRALGTGREEQRAAVTRLVDAAVRANGLPAAEVPTPGAAERLDEEAWDLQEQAERGHASQADYEEAFRRARAASAAQLLADPAADPLDAAYEAVHALPPGTDALALVRTLPQ